ncbi:MAG: MlaC/ttg2D family ABC transporter substrate-binding protein [Gammaproteobacteria bacterium]
MSTRGIWAAAFAALATVSTAAPVPPDEVVKTTTERLQQEIAVREKEFKADQGKLYAFVEEIIVPKFDTKYIAQLILARHWKGASNDQRKRFQAAFKDMLVHSYANALVEYHTAVKPEWQPLRMAKDATDVTVNSRLLREGKPPLPIGFAMRLKDGEWRVYDIVIENLSLVTSFRGQINSEIKRSSLDALIQRLESGQRVAPETKG